MFDSFQIGCMVLGSLVLMAIAVPVVLPVFLPLLIIFVLLRRRCVSPGLRLCHCPPPPQPRGAGDVLLLRAVGPAKAWATRARSAASAFGRVRRALCPTTIE